MEIITVEMSWFYHSPEQKSNFIQNEYVTVFKWVHLHSRHAKCILFKNSSSPRHFTILRIITVKWLPVKKFLKVNGSSEK